MDMYHQYVHCSDHPMCVLLLAVHLGRFCNCIYAEFLINLVSIIINSIRLSLTIGTEPHGLLV